jgi:zinc/manganese transport system ATP-binding protein
MTPALQLTGAELSFDGRTLWSQMDVGVQPGEFVAVLGSNGAGKSSLLKVLLGLQPLSAGKVELLGKPAARGRRDVGYIPQHRGYSANVPLRARDLVKLGIDGHRWGLRGMRSNEQLVDQLLVSVDATAYANAPLGQLSGGEQQRLRVAQALASRPQVLLCDEPLQSLDLNRQRSVVELIDRDRRERGTTVMFVTHEINPVLSAVDRVLYIINGAFRFGTPDEVMTSEVLSELYDADIEVIRRGHRVIVVGADDAEASHHVHHDHAHRDHEIA